MTPNDQQLAHKLEEARRVHHQEKGCKNGEYVTLLEEITDLRTQLAVAQRQRDALAATVAELQRALKRIGYVNGDGTPKHTPDADTARKALAAMQSKGAQ